MKYAGLSSSQSNRQSILKKSSASATARASAIRAASKRSLPWVWWVSFAIDKLTFAVGANSCFYIICCYSDQHLHSLHKIQKLQDVHEKGMFHFLIQLPTLKGRQDPISSPNARKIQLDLDLDQSREETPEFERKAGLSDYIVITTGFLWKYFM